MTPERSALAEDGIAIIGIEYDGVGDTPTSYALKGFRLGTLRSPPRRHSLSGRPGAEILARYLLYAGDPCIIAI